LADAFDEVGGDLRFERVVGCLYHDAANSGA